ncbi:Aste57867_22472 [Aphanomyces stellatus]|uniref:Aste57867_22472 protein n=1 Tax=Aphanomyces stellatus TaxID=120398 RepID=A0A485LKF6_9STRA|nr:hypothetical protein As57867_022402 [Aphanomyces stellatus]VFT99132.1 Aste57867_22472 [Aphanomyces stellatus]
MTSSIVQRAGVGLSLLASGTAAGVWFERSAKTLDEPPKEEIVTIAGAIGNTPLLEIKSLSKLTGCRILAKAEFMNPSGSVKDRAAKYLIEDAEKEGNLKPGGTVVEATGGNTGLGLAIVAASKGYKTIFTMPDKTSSEKIELMQVLGATVHVQPSVGMDDPEHFYNVAKRIVAADPLCFGPDQFENVANSRAHYEGTGPEIWHQTAGKVDGFIVASGTGGTIGGVSKFLKEKNPAIQVWHIDPNEGGASSDYVNSKQTNSKVAPNGFEVIPKRDGSTIAEGIGLARVTPNFKFGAIDKGIFGTNVEIVKMAYYLLRHEGACQNSLARARQATLSTCCRACVDTSIFVGPSAALNVVGAVKMAQALGPGHTVVTVLCDGGDRYRSKLFNAAWLAEHNLTESVNLPLEL